LERNEEGNEKIEVIGAFVHQETRIPKYIDELEDMRKRIGLTNNVFYSQRTIM
jgi:hypothetical protein